MSDSSNESSLSPSTEVSAVPSKRRKMETSNGSGVDSYSNDSILGTEWELKHTKRELAVLRVKLFETEAAGIQHHKLRKQIEELFEKEKSILQKQAQVDRETIEQLREDLKASMKSLREAREAKTVLEAQLSLAKTQMRNQIAGSLKTYKKSEETIRLQNIELKDAKLTIERLNKEKRIREMREAPVGGKKSEALQKESQDEDEEVTAIVMKKEPVVVSSGDSSDQNETVILLANTSKRVSSPDSSDSDDSSSVILPINQSSSSAALNNTTRIIVGLSPRSSSFGGGKNEDDPSSPSSSDNSSEPLDQNPPSSSNNSNDSENAMDRISRRLSIGNHYVLVSSEQFYQLDWDAERFRGGLGHWCCKKCSYTSPNKVGIEDHVWTTHYGGKFECPHCDICHTLATGRYAAMEYAKRKHPDKYQ
ncbi:PH domain-containing rcdII [Diachasma alloeum]|uniref:PH domain-containing rcdII n=1 Tax=Diachasma alloeum TaxID=454923 RepID=UPI0007384CE3|nr:PH domain-containing rcdII [Diachasma alloeum]